MRLAILSFGLLLGLCGLSGCTGVVQSQADRENTYRQALDMDTRQLVDDWDALWLADRKYRLTRWEIR